MSDLIILGTVAIDSIETPFGKAPNTLGGSASYSSVAASFFAAPSILSIIGKDFPQEHLDFLQSKGVKTDSIQVGDKTFRWEGYYEFDMNEAKTLKTELNDLATYQVEVPDELKKAKYLFLGNIDPEQQLKVMQAVNAPELIVMDTMNFWIDSKKEQLLETIRHADVLVFNDGEARQLFDTPNLIAAGKEALKLVKKAVIIKKGEHGALLFCDGKVFSAPGYPLEVVKDPTGCGDCFGGGFTGYLAKSGDVSEENMRKAVVYGSVIASHNAEDFGTSRLKTLTMEDIENRFKEMRALREF